MEKKISQIEQIHGGHDKLKLSLFGHLFRFLASWFGITGLYAMFSVCPFCGQQGCPVGMASAGGVGAFFALCLQDWRRFFAYIKGRFSGGAKPGAGQ